MTTVSTLCAEARETARRLLTHYVKVQGLVISQMLRKSVETRDWLSTLEPRNVRAVMKRVVEDTTAIDVQVLPQAGRRCWGNSPLRIKTAGVRQCLHLWPPSPQPWWHHHPHFTSEEEAEAQSHWGNRGRVDTEDWASVPIHVPPLLHSTGSINNDWVPARYSPWLPLHTPTTLCLFYNM